MSRLSGDEIKDGVVVNGFDYDLQVWVVNGIIQACGHPWGGATDCCNAGRYAGRSLVEVIAERKTGA